MPPIAAICTKSAHWLRDSIDHDTDSLTTVMAFSPWLLLYAPFIWWIWDPVVPTALRPTTPLLCDATVLFAFLSIGLLLFGHSFVSYISVYVHLFSHSLCTPSSSQHYGEI